MKKSSLKEELQRILNKNKKLKKVQLTKNEKEKFLYNGIKITNTFQNVPISISKEDQDLRLTYIDFSHPTLNSKGLLGKRVDEVFSLNKNTLKIINVKQKVLETGVSKNQKITHPTPNINIVYRMICEPIYNKSKQIIGVSTILIEITEQERLERLLIHSEKLAEIGQFATGIAHEFNNILANIMGEIDILLLQEKQNQNNLTTNTINKLKKIKEKGHKAKKIAYDIMNISKPKDKEKKLYDVTEAIDQILEIKKRELIT